MASQARPRVSAILLVMAVLVAVGLAITSFVGFAQRTNAPPQSAEKLPGGLASMPLNNALVFRNTQATDDYGKVAWIPLDHLQGPRINTGLACDRVYRTGGMLSCLNANRGMNTTYEADIYSVGGQRLASSPLPGEPSRTRVSASGMVGVTAFITGESYENVGFSTQTTIKSPGGKDFGNIQDFTLKIGNKILTAEDRNLWGVTFAKDGNTFFATAASGKQTWLMRGSLTGKTLTALSENAECPSISPNGKLIAYKKRRTDSLPAHWDIAVQDLAKGTEQIYPLELGFDDQLEWLDADTLLFGQPRADNPGDADIYSLALEADSTPKLFLEHAWSPSVQR